MFKTSGLFHANYNSTADIVINQGGTDSGKTWAIIQVLLRYCTEKAPTESPTITIISQTIPDSRKGAYRILKAIFESSEYLRNYVSSWSETDRTIYFKTGWRMEFVAYPDEQRAKQDKRQYAFFNEANGIPYQVFWQVAKRTRIRTFIDYQPSAPFWAHEKLIGLKPEENDLFATVQLIISDHRHNPFLTEKDHQKTEIIKDPELWRVYARGWTGNLTGIIFPDWREAEFPNHDYIFFGLDVGWTESSSKPSGKVALMKMAKIGNNLFVDEILSEIEKTPDDIINILRAIGYSQDQPIYCDHAPEFIRELRMKEITAIPARKGPGSVVAGIMKIKELNVFYTPRSKALKDNLKRYMWIIDANTGKPTNAPIDAFNDEIDAIRMGVMSNFWHSQ